MILSRFPYPLEKGDKLRAFHQIKELSKTYRITLFAINEIKIAPSDLKMVENYCENIEICQLTKVKVAWNLISGLFSTLPFQVHYFRASGGKRRIKELIKQNDFKHIYCQLIRTAELVKDLHHIPKTLDYMDALSAGIERRIDRRPWYDKWLFRTEAKRLKAFERKIFDFFEHHTIISAQDRLLITHPDRDRIVTITNGIEPAFFEPLTRTERYDFVFVGNMSYPPNVDAVKSIAQHILPAFPESKLLVSGATPHASLTKLAASNPQIDITGWVDDIRTAYLDGKVFLAPMSIGTGMQNKLLEAMALRTPCVTTDLANTPIGATNEKEILVGNTPEAIIEHLKTMLHSETKRREIAAAAQEFVRTKYSWEQTTQQLVQLMEQNAAESTIN